MDDDDAGQPPPTVLLMINSWQATLMLGLVTIVFGVIVTAHPNGPLRVLAILVGIAAIVSGIFHLIRAADGAARHRLWLGISGLLFVALGVVLIRHLHMTLALIGVLVGIWLLVLGLLEIVAALILQHELAVASPAYRPATPWSSRPDAGG